MSPMHKDFNWCLSIEFSDQKSSCNTELSHERPVLRP